MLGMLLFSGNCYFVQSWYPFPNHLNFRWTTARKNRKHFGAQKVDDHLECSVLQYVDAGPEGETGNPGSKHMGLIVNQHLNGPPTV